MLSLFFISTILSIVIGLKSALLYKEVSDQKLGYEEIIAVSILLGAGINTYIDVMNIISYIEPTFGITIKHISVLSRLAEGLISYCIIQYVSQMHKIRLVSKE